MQPATDAQIREACTDRSATEASRHLRDQGFDAGMSRCNTIIARMISAGERFPMASYRFTDAMPDRTCIDRFDAEMGCKRLLAAQLRAGAHWIHDRERMEQALREAGMVA